MNSIRAVIAASLFATSCLAIPAFATSVGTDQSDLWYVPAESGWGMQLVQRGSVIFATIFVYGQSGAPTWYVATMNPQGPASTWSGPLYASTGPWFGTMPFDPTLVVQSQVGTMTWVTASVESGMLTYSVGGVMVNKILTRETIAGDDFGGTFVGLIHADTTGCANAALNVPSEQAGGIVIVQNGTSMGVQTFPVGGNECSFSGSANEFGQMGEVAGNFSCFRGNAGSFSFFEMQVTESGLTGRMQLNYSNPPGCQSTGWFGGARATITKFQNG
jgi:hypothetical protein